MNTVTICLCEDEKIWYERVVKECYKNGYDVKITFCDDRNIDYEQDYDIYLLDMQLHEQEGEDVAKQILTHHRDACIVYFTSYESYARSGYDYHSIGFIYKPNFEADFKKVMSRVIKKVYSKKLCFHLFVDGALCKVRLSDISSVVSDGHYIRVHMNNRIVRVRMSMKHFMDTYDRDDFVLVKIGVYANMKHIAYIDETSVHFDDERVVSIPKRRRKEVLNRYTDYLEKTML